MPMEWFISLVIFVTRFDLVVMLAVLIGAVAELSFLIVFHLLIPHYDYFLSPF